MAVMATIVGLMVVVSQVSANVGRVTVTPASGQCSGLVNKIIGSGSIKIVVRACRVCRATDLTSCAESHGRIQGCAWSETRRHAHFLWAEMRRLLGDTTNCQLSVAHVPILSRWSRCTRVHHPLLTDRPNTPFVQTAGSVADCCTACLVSDSCVAFTFDSAEVKGGCFLKDNADDVGCVVECAVSPSLYCQHSNLDGSMRMHSFGIPVALLVWSRVVSCGADLLIVKCANVNECLPSQY